jgi:hypothetical protein
MYFLACLPHPGKALVRVPIGYEDDAPAFFANAYEMMKAPFTTMCNGR